MGAWSAYEMVPLTLSAGRAEAASTTSEITSISKTLGHKFKFGLSLRLGHKSLPYTGQLPNVSRALLFMKSYSRIYY